MARAEKLAAQYRSTVEELLRNLVQEKAIPARAGGGDLVGYLADEPELVDQIMDDVYRTRETQTLRTPLNGSRD